jgi:hypothetical protein
MQKVISVHFEPLQLLAHRDCRLLYLGLNAMLAHNSGLALTQNMLAGPSFAVGFIPVPPPKLPQGKYHVVHVLGWLITRQAG